ncbi:MAG: hypothetical protein ACOY99_04300 [Pseudomonadota bacterium]
MDDTSAPYHAFLAPDMLRSPFLALGQADTSLAIALPLNKAMRLSLAAAATRETESAPWLFGPEALPQARTTTAAARLDRRLGHAALAFELGAQWESRQVLGGRGNGALSLGEGATTAFMGISSNLPLGLGWALSAQASYALSRITPGADGLVTDFTGLRLSAFSASLARQAVIAKNDWLGLALRQPLRVEAGSGALLLPLAVEQTVGRTQVLFTPRTLALGPSGRELDIELAYRWLMGERLMVEANGLYQFDAGHVAGARGAALLLRLGGRF